MQFTCEYSKLRMILYIAKGLDSIPGFESTLCHWWGADSIKNEPRFSASTNTIRKPIKKRRKFSLSKNEKNRQF